MPLEEAAIMKPPLVGGDAKWPLEEAMLLYDVMLPVEAVIFPLVRLLYDVIMLPPRGGGVSEGASPEK